MLVTLLALALSASYFGPAVPAPGASGVTGRRPAVPVDGHARIPHVSPESVGMSASRLARIDEVMRRGISAGGFPGGAVIVGRRGAIVWERGYGNLDWRSGVPVDAERTMYDLASLTKVVATTAAAMVLADRGKLRLDEPVVRYLPAFGGGSRDEITIRDLLTHRSGLPAGRNLSRRGAGQPYLQYSWFVGFAPADAPKVTIAVLLGNGELWHLKAHTAARMVLERAL